MGQTIGTLGQRCCQLTQLSFAHPTATSVASELSAIRPAVERDRQIWGYRVPSASPYSTGGGGVVLEQLYGATLLAALLCGDLIDELGDDVVPVKIRFQAANVSRVDDFVVEGHTRSGALRVLAAAVRRDPTLTRSDSESVPLVRSFLDEVTKHDAEFAAGNRRLALIVGKHSTAVGQLRDLATMASACESAADFRAAMARAGASNAGVRSRLAHVEGLVAAAVANTTVTAVGTDELTWRWLSVFSVRTLEVQGRGTADRTSAIKALRYALDPNAPLDAATDLFNELYAIVGRKSPLGATVTRDGLVQQLSRFPLDMSRNGGSSEAVTMENAATSSLRFSREAMGRSDSDDDITFPSATLTVLGDLDNPASLGPQTRELEDWLAATERLLLSARIASLPPTSLRDSAVSDTEWGPGFARSATSCSDWTTLHSAVDVLQQRTEDRVGSEAGERHPAEAGHAASALDQIANVLDAVELACLADLKDLREYESTITDTQHAQHAVELNSHHARSEVLQFVEFCEATQQVARRLRERWRTESSGVLLLEGDWGTGKSYLLGRYARDRLRRACPTVFVPGREIRIAAARGMSAVAFALGASADTAAVVRALARESAATQQRGIVVLDAINESSDTALEQNRLFDALVEAVSAEPWLLLVVSRRAEGPSPRIDHPSIGYRFHTGVDPSHSWEMLRRYFGLPPVLVPWSIPDYRRPLILRMFARVCRSRASEVATPMGIGHLITAWLDVLSEGFVGHDAQGLKSVPPRHHRLRGVLDIINASGGSCHRLDLEKRLREHIGDDGPRAVDFLIDEGVLVQTGTTIGYALQRVSEFETARHVLLQNHQSGNAGEAAEFEDLAEFSRPDAATEAEVALAPYVINAELLGPRPKSWRKGVPVAFVWSLDHRAPEAVFPETVAGAGALLRYPDLRVAVWLAALTNSVYEGHPVGPQFIGDQLHSSSVAARLDLWIHPISSALAATHDSGMRRSVGEIVLWIDDQARTGQLSPRHASELAGVLLWLTTLPSGRASVAATRVLATIVRRYAPITDGAIVTSILSTARAMQDLDAEAAAWASVYGALLRDAGSPSNGLRSAIDGAVTPLLDRASEGASRLPLHHRLDLAAFQVRHFLQLTAPATSPTLISFRHFLQEFVEPSRRLLPTALSVRLSRDRDVVRQSIDDDVEHFVDPAGFRYQHHRNRFAALARARWGSAAGRLLTDLAGTSTRDDPRRRKVLEETSQIWLAEQCRDYQVGSTGFSTVTGPMPYDAGDGDDASTDDAWFPMIDDASVGARDPFIADESLPLNDWRMATLVEGVKGAAEWYVTDGSELQCKDPGGRTWWVIDARLELEDPPDTSSYPVEQLLQGYNGEDFTHRPPRLPPGFRGSVHVEIRTLVIPLDDAGPGTDRAALFEHMDAESYLERSETPVAPMLGEALHWSATATTPAPKPPFATSTRFEPQGRHHDPFRGRRIPSPDLLRTLDARWCGDGNDFAALGSSVLTGAFGGHSHTLVIAADSISRLHSLGLTLSWEITVTRREGRERSVKRSHTSRWSVTADGRGA